MVSFTPGRFTPRERAPDTYWIGGQTKIKFTRIVLLLISNTKFHENPLSISGLKCVDKYLYDRPISRPGY